MLPFGFKHRNDTIDLYLDSIVYFLVHIVTNLMVLDYMLP